MKLDPLNDWVGPENPKSQEKSFRVNSKQPSSQCRKSCGPQLACFQGQGAHHLSRQSFCKEDTLQLDV